MGRLAASGFRDTSRLASSDSELAKGISMTNQAGLLHWLDTYLSVLLEWRKTLLDDPDRFLEALGEAREARDKWLSGQLERGLISHPDIPTAGEQMAEMFMGSRLSQAMKEQTEKLRDK